MLLRFVAELYSRASFRDYLTYYLLFFRNFFMSKKYLFLRFISFSSWKCFTGIHGEGITRDDIFARIYCGCRCVGCDACAVSASSFRVIQCLHWKGRKWAWAEWADEGFDEREASLSLFKFAYLMMIQGGKKNNFNVVLIWWWSHEIARCHCLPIFF